MRCSGVEYIVYGKDDKIITYMAVGYYFVNGPKTTIASVEQLASTDTLHSSSMFIDALKQDTGITLCICQCMQTMKAQKFWQKKFTISSLAPFYHGLIYIYDENAKLYHDATMMMS